MTKSKGIGRGGRRKGAGRRRFAKTGKSSYFSTRITQQTRDLLEAEARRSGKKLSSTVARLLNRALKEVAEERRPGSLRGLFFVMEILLRRVGGMSLDHSWRSSPYRYAAFRAGVIGLLDVLRPAGEIVTPPPRKLRWVGENAEFGRELWGDDIEHKYPESPEKYGLECLELILEDMDTWDSRRKEPKFIGPDGDEIELGFDDHEDPREFYGLGRANAILGLPIRRWEE